MGCSFCPVRRSPRCLHSPILALAGGLCSDATSPPPPFPAGLPRALTKRESASLSWPPRAQACGFSTRTAVRSASVTKANKARSRATAGPCPRQHLPRGRNRLTIVNHLADQSWGVATCLQQQQRANFPPSPRMHANSSAGWWEQTNHSGSVSTGKPTSHLIYFQFIHGAHGEAGVQLHLSINLLPTRDGDSIPERSFRTRKQFNLRRHASPEGPAL